MDIAVRPYVGHVTCDLVGTFTPRQAHLSRWQAIQTESGIMPLFASPGGANGRWRDRTACDGSITEHLCHVAGKMPCVEHGRHPEANGKTSMRLSRQRLPISAVSWVN